jgi:hypothetical protein
VLASNLSVYIYIYIKVHKIFFTYGSWTFFHSNPLGLKAYHGPTLLLCVY